MSAHAPPAPVRRVRRRRRRMVRRVGVNVLGIAVLVVMVFPVYWTVSTALKPSVDILTFTPKWYPSPATLVNFEHAISRPNFWNGVKNSLVLVSAVTALSVVLAFLAALALAKFRFYGRTAFIVVQMVPLNALIIPLDILLSRAGQVDKLSGVIVTYPTWSRPRSSRSSRSGTSSSSRTCCSRRPRSRR